MVARNRERSNEMQIAEPTGADKRSRLDRPVQTVNASELLGPSGLLRIELDGEIYTLRLTRNHRLILTK
jgi:hemin uptake protein HemP